MLLPAWGTDAMKDNQSRIICQVPTKLLEEVERVNKQIEMAHGITLSAPDSYRLALLVYARAAEKAIAGKQILSVGELEQALIAALRLTAEENGN
jgi:hypothetical protein